MIAVSSKAQSFIFLSTSFLYLNYTTFNVVCQRLVLIILILNVDFKRLMMYIDFEVINMLKLKLRELMFEKRWNARQLSDATGIRWNSIDDMMENRSKRWTVENLEKIMDVLDIKDISDLIEYVNDNK